MKIQVIMLKQDDPKKCSAAKLVKFGLAKNIKNLSNKTLILDPFATKTTLKNDRKLIDSITGIDCSWNLTEKTFATKFSGIHRKLPPLFAGNPLNYSKLNKLTTVEALAAAAFILGYKDLCLQLLDKFKWGHTFFELNKNLLEDYANIEYESEITSLLKEYEIRI